MKKLIAPLFVLLLAASCSNSNENKSAVDSVKKDSTVAMLYFGDTITADGAVPATEVMAKLAGKDSVPVKLEGKIAECCQKKGCWMAIETGNGQTMRVTFKDYGFFVPKDAAGKTAIVDGYAYIDTTTVAQLRHYAEDGGASKDSIAKITEPEVEVSFEAHGVIIR